MRQLRLNRRAFLRASLIAAGAVGLDGIHGILRARRAPVLINRRRPNLLLITTDQEMSWAGLPPSVSLPERERLRAAGVEFESFYANTAPGAPSRSNIYTGRHVQHTGVIDGPGVPLVAGDMSVEIPTLCHLFRRRGYYTAYKGKWHLSDIPFRPGRSARDALEAYGFADYNPAGDVPGDAWSGYLHDELTAQDAARWLYERAPVIASEKPWLLAVNFANPHDIVFFDATGSQARTRVNPSFPSKSRPQPDTPLYHERFQIELPASFERDGLSPQLQAHRDYLEYCDLTYGAMPKARDDAWIRFLNYYFNCLRDVDRSIGSLLRALEWSGQAGQTIVVFTSNHGEMGGAHGFRLKGPFVYEENLRVPFIVRHPAVSGGTTASALACAVDIVPTLLGLVGLRGRRRRKIYPQLVGHDLSSALSDPKARGPRDDAGILLSYSTLHTVDPSFVEKVLAAEAPQPPWSKVPLLLSKPWLPDFARRGFFRGVFDGRYKFARYFAPSEHHTPRDWDTLIAHNDLELYDTLEDPKEMANLAQNPEAHRELILRLNAKVNDLVEREVGNDDGGYLPGPAVMWRL